MNSINGSSMKKTCYDKLEWWVSVNWHVVTSEMVLRLIIYKMNEDGLNCFIQHKKKMVFSTVKRCEWNSRGEFFSSRFTISILYVFIYLRSNTVPLVRVSNETWPRAAFWLADTKGPTNQSAERSLVSFSFNKIKLVLRLLNFKLYFNYICHFTSICKW